MHIDGALANKMQRCFGTPLIERCGFILSGPKAEFSLAPHTYNPKESKQGSGTLVGEISKIGGQQRIKHENATHRIASFDKAANRIREQEPRTTCIKEIEFS